MKSTTEFSKLNVLKYHRASSKAITKVKKTIIKNRWQKSYSELGVCSVDRNCKEAKAMSQIKKPEIGTLLGGATLSVDIRSALEIRTGVFC